MKRLFRLEQPVAATGGAVRTEPAAGTHDVYLSLGSNMGDRMRHLQSAVKALAAEPRIEVVKLSSVYETDPWGLTTQRAFFNAVVRIRTTLLPLRLLCVCQKIERREKRKREIRWGPRTLDIDILMYDRVVMHSARLTLPHPRIQERDFVLVPLAEVQSGLLLERPGVHRLSDHWPDSPDSTDSPDSPDSPDATGNL